MIEVEEYFDHVVSDLTGISEIFSLVLKKQAKDLEIGKRASPKEIDELIERVASAMEFFVGKKGMKNVRRIMRNELRKEAPQYFKAKYGL